MKNLIILSLVAIGLAKYVNAFVYPGPSKGSKYPSFSWNEFGGIDAISELIDSPNPERPRREADVESATKQKQFVLGNVKLVKNGNFGKIGIQQKARSGTSTENSKPFQDEQEKPFVSENKVPVLENGKASSSESSSNGQSGESAAANKSSKENADPAANQSESSSSEENSASAANREGFSSSEENAAPAANQGESSSSEESNAPSANQEGSSSSEENAAPAANEGESGSEEEIAEVVKRFTKQEAAANLGLQPFVSVKPLIKRRSLVFSVRDVDHVGRNSPRQGNVPGSRRPREIATNFRELSYKGVEQGPQGQIVGAGTRKRGRAAKK